MINLSIDLSKIDKSRIKEGKNGQKFYSITVDSRKEKDQYDNTHTVYQTPTKEEREAKAPKVYIGNGKEFIFNNQQQNNQQSTYATQVNSNPSPDTVDDLPF